MQTAVMEKLQQQMMSNIDKVSPESLLRSPVHLRSQDCRNAFQDMFVAMAGLGSSVKKDKK